MRRFIEAVKDSSDETATDDPDLLNVNNETLFTSISQEYGA